MSIWSRIGDFVSRISARASAGVSDMVEALRGMFEGDPELRRRVAFSVAMIALSAKMARADGVATQVEFRAFERIFAVPEDQRRNVVRLYDLAAQDTAGFEVYADRMARMCGSGHSNCRMLEDILDGLFFIAKSDGHIHDKEVTFLRRISEIFDIEAAHFEAILARHAVQGARDPYVVLGVVRGTPFEEIKRRYRKLVSENHPDRLIARGVPREFVAIATDRIAAINVAFEAIEKGRVAA